MAKEKILFIQNRGMYDLTVSAVRLEKTDDGNGGFYNKRVEYLTKTFGIRREDNATGRLVSTGFTALTEKEYASLEKDCKFFVGDIKNGNLVKFEDAPQEALLDTELVSSLQEKNAALAAELEEAKNLLVNAAPELNKLGNELSAVKARVEELEAENAAMKDENERLVKASAAAGGDGL